jgi:hypothetical protein
MRTNLQSQVDGLPNECKIKKRWSKETIMLATSELIGGAGGGLGMVREGGGPLYNTGGSSILLRDITRSHSLLSIHGNGQTLLFKSAKVGKWKLQKLPFVTKWLAI